MARYYRVRVADGWAHAFRVEGAAPHWSPPQRQGLSMLGGRNYVFSWSSFMAQSMSQRALNISGIEVENLVSMNFTGPYMPTPVEALRRTILS